jgi:hypothetical protein
MLASGEFVKPSARMLGDTAGGGPGLLRSSFGRNRRERWADLADVLREQLNERPHARRPRSSRFRRGEYCDPLEILCGWMAAGDDLRLLFLLMEIDRGMAPPASCTRLRTTEVGPPRGLSGDGTGGLDRALRVAHPIQTVQTEVPANALALCFPGPLP